MKIRLRHVGLTIIAILILVALKPQIYPKIDKVKIEAERSAALALMTEIDNSILKFKHKNGHLPSSLEDVEIKIFPDN